MRTDHREVSPCSAVHVCSGGWSLHGCVLRNYLTLLRLQPLKLILPPHAEPDLTRWSHAQIPFWDVSSIDSVLISRITGCCLVMHPPLSHRARSRKHADMLTPSPSSNRRRQDSIAALGHRAAVSRPSSLPRAVERCSSPREGTPLCASCRAGETRRQFET